MTKQDDEQTLNEVLDRLAPLLAKCRRRWRFYIAVLLGVLSLGLGLMVFGAVAGRWEGLVAGPIATALIYFPLRRLNEIREQETMLELFPELVRLAGPKDGKMLVQAFAIELIRKGKRK